MKKSGLALALLLVAPACSKLAHKLHAKHEHYTTYTNKDLHFSIETPRKPRTEGFPISTLDGPTESQHVSFNPERPAMIAVWVTPMPFADLHKYTPKRIFDFEVGKLLRTIAGRISHQQNVTVNGVRGREIEATGNVNADFDPGDVENAYPGSKKKGKKRDIPESALVRMFYRNATLYQVIAIYPTSASGTSIEAKRVVRSFKPIALPKLTPGVGEVSGLTCSPESIDRRHYYVAMNPKFTIKLQKRLKPGDKIRVQAWCHTRSRFDTEDTMSESWELLDEDMDKLRRQGKLSTNADISLNYVHEAPDICQFSFRVRSGSEDRASLGDFCWTKARVTKGRCGM